MISPWAPGYNVVGEKLKRNTTTNQVSERSITTACASNLGDVKVKDIDGIINRGKKVGLGIWYHNIFDEKVYHEPFV